MRSFVSAAMTIFLAAIPTVSAEPSVALRGEGYVGYSNLDFESYDDDAFQGGGTGSASIVFDQIYLQGDVFGDDTDFEDLESETVGGGLHLGWRDAERGSFGAAGAYNNRDGGLAGDTIDVWRGGLEGELFLDRVTLALNSGYLQIDDDSTGYFDAGLSYYPTDRARLQVGGGLFDIEESDPWGAVSAGAEFLLFSPLAAFARWEAAFVNDSTFELAEHSIVFGLRLYWGAEEPSLLIYDRAHFKRVCSGFLLVGSRLC